MKAKPMPQPSEYRKRAQECVELAQTVRTSAQRVMLLHIAETWLRLANDSLASMREPAGDMPTPALN